MQQQLDDNCMEVETVLQETVLQETVLQETVLQETKPFFFLISPSSFFLVSTK